MILGRAIISFSDRMMMILGRAIISFSDRILFLEISPLSNIRAFEGDSTSTLHMSKFTRFPEAFTIFQGSRAHLRMVFITLGTSVAPSRTSITMCQHFTAWFWMKLGATPARYTIATSTFMVKRAYLRKVCAPPCLV